MIKDKPSWRTDLFWRHAGLPYLIDPLQKSKLKLAQAKIGMPPVLKPERAVR